MRLNSKAYAYLTKELRQVANEKGLQVQLDLVLKRLKKLSETEGAPLNQAEIAEQITDLFLDFDEIKLAKAARLNLAKNWGLWLTGGRFRGRRGGIYRADLVGQPPLSHDSSSRC